MPSIRDAPTLFHGLLPAAFCAAALLASGDGVADGERMVATPLSLNERKTTDPVVCYDMEAFPGRMVLRGNFSGDGRRSGLVLWNSDGDSGCAIGREVSGSQSVFVGREWSYAKFALGCRDSVTGRDHAIVHVSGGQFHEIQVWTADPDDTIPVPVYREAWGDAVYEYPGDEWGRDRLVAGDGTCLWRDLKSAREVYRKAMVALQVGKGYGSLNNGPDVLWSRKLDAATVRRWFVALRNAEAVFEGATYADPAARRSWGIVQVTNSEACGGTGGAVLTLDRRTGAWRSIYDILPGCSKVLYFGMREMVVDGDLLYARLCTDCMYWGDWANFVIDLRSGRTVPLDLNAEIPEPSEGGNPQIRDPVAEFFHE